MLLSPHSSENLSAEALTVSVLRLWALWLPRLPVLLIQRPAVPGMVWGISMGAWVEMRAFKELEGVASYPRYGGKGWALCITGLS